MDRRNFFQGSALMSTGALLGCATPGIAQQKVKTPFDVPQVYIPVVGSDEMFPVRRIYCIGRNYAAHAREMGSDPTREPPFFFQKPTDAIQYVAAGTVANHPYPPLTKNYHYEAELVAALGKGGRNIPVEKALDLVWGYTLGLDMTVRGVEERSYRKSPDSYTVLGPAFVTADEIKDPHALTMSLWVNGERRQHSSTGAMTVDIPDLIEFASRAYTLHPGDVILTGTPEGVGPVLKGDKVRVACDGLGEMTFAIRERTKP